MAVATPSVTELCARAKRAARRLAQLDRGAKDAALHAIADALEARTAEILEANARDMEAGAEASLSSALLDRLRLDDARVATIAAQVRDIAALPDPVGEVIDGERLANGLMLRRVRVPLGVVGVVYEARPNVTIDAAARDDEVDEPLLPGQLGELLAAAAGDEREELGVPVLVARLDQPVAERRAGRRPRPPVDPQLDPRPGERVEAFT